MGLSEADAGSLVVKLGAARELTWLSGVTDFLNGNTANSSAAIKDLINNPFAPQLGFDNPDKEDLADSIRDLINNTDIQIANNQTPTGVVLYDNPSHPHYDPRIQNETIEYRSLQDFLDELDGMTASVQSLRDIDDSSLNLQIVQVQQSFAAIRLTRDPLVIDFDGDGVAEVTNPTRASVYFDMDSNGFAEAVSWVGNDDALLVRDVNGNGQIDNANELFGSSTLNGFAALAAIDSNNDGVINSNDSAWNDLQVWPRDLLRPINLSHSDRLKIKDNWSHTNKNIRVKGLAVHKEPTNDNSAYVQSRYACA